LAEQDFLEPATVIQLGNPPNRIDLLTSTTGVDFETCYESRLVVDVDDVSVNFIDLVNLRKNKRAVGRQQDLADLDNLE
jgi:hypothetical protein